MKIGVIGSGAVGGFYGAMLRKAGHEVIFLARGRHLQAMRENGLRVIADFASFQVNGTFTDSLKSVSMAELLLFTVKSTDTRETAAALSPLLKADSFVLTLQNGVDNEEVLAEVFGRERVLSGAAYLSSHIEQPGVIRQQGPYSIIMGALAPSAGERAAAVQEMFQASGIECRLSKSILARKWNKLLWNVTFNPLSAAAKATVGEILDCQDLRSTAERVLQEAVQIGRACGVEISQQVIDRIFPGAEQVRHHKTSMLQDRESGKKMEIESLCGFFVRKSAALRMEVPALQTLYGILKSIEAKEVS
ncbi:ketopantoate reductase family protein [Brevibacillus massiliensis]|jgi:2-dehydropantoate 2-reductase|uniref:ketopantoate reductase family protein n=1 Tax=Brevibacillus massiliensis TaxID=1118054 RepID=UPI0002FE2A61|nr:ketopantoate reductase family protein [Brevibacillus massiliensis]